ncbi:MAG: alpha/beta hydrolase [Bacillaceae bacterium]|nr:alpha/beta hydrolase [Bacillaceae bacterium]
MPVCNIEDLEMYYQVYGEGKPIIMIHGFSLDSELMIGCMEPVFREKNGFKRIYIDLPGMGRTKGGKHISGSDDMLDAVIRFIDKVIPEQSFLLAGESYGGYLSLGIIEKKADQVEGAAFICPMIIPEVEERALPEHTVIAEDQDFMGQLQHDYKKDFCSVSVVHDEYNWKRFESEVVSGAERADSEFLAKIKQHYGFTFHPIQTVFDKPCVFLTGKQDSGVGYKDAFHIQDYFPRATFAVLDKAGHLLQMEQPGLFNAHIQEWLDRTLKTGS